MTLSNERKLVSERDELVERARVSIENGRIAKGQVLRYGAQITDAESAVDAILPGGFDAAVERGSNAVNDEAWIIVTDYGTGKRKVIPLEDAVALILRAALGLDGAK